MKISMIIYLFATLFGAGYTFLWLNAHFSGRRFRLNLKSAAASVWVSALLMAAASVVHHQGMLLGEHLIFDALGSIIFAVLLSCAVALVRELRLMHRKSNTCRTSAHRRGNVVVMHQKSRRPVVRGRDGRIAA